MSYCPKCDTTYETNVKICPRDGTVLEGTTTAKDSRVGEVLDGKYRLDATLGQGGMGAIYRATHLMLDKQVAVKLIKPELVTSPDIVRRFQREARAAGNLNHPNIAAAYDLGQTSDGTLYIAMELINGPSLKDVIRSGGPMAVDRIVRIMRQVGDALALAHRHNIIHRDLKPHNVMLATGNGVEVPKLLDFGIAKTFDDASTQLTATGFVLGTPQYMSPEQAAGRPIDGRSDLYSLGIILYEMLIGEVPFNDPSTPAVLVKHLTEPPSPPSSRRPDVAVSPVLESIALRLLAKEPADRYQSADEFVAALPDAAGPTVAVPRVDQDATVVLGSTPPSAMPARAPSQADATVVAAPLSTSASYAPTVMPMPTPPSAAAAGAAAAAATAATVMGAGAATKPPAAPAPAAATPRQATVPAAPAPAAAAYAAASGETSGRSRDLRNLLIIAAALVLIVGGGAYAAMRIFGGDGTPAEAVDATAQTLVDNATGAPPAPAGALSTEPMPAPASAGTPVAAAADATKPARSGGAADAPFDPSQIRLDNDDKPASARTAKPQVQIPAAAPAAPAVPATPTVAFRCDGAPQVCSALRAAMTDAFSRHSLRPSRDAAAADVVVDASVSVVNERSETLYGQNFVTRTYAIELNGDARDGESVPMPAASNLTFDASVGQERLDEHSRQLATTAAARVQTFWRGRTGG